MNPAIPVKIGRIDMSELISEIDSENKLLQEKNSWNNCYFYRVDSDLFHPDGKCCPCDWKRYMSNLSDEDIDSFNFIEAWEWEDVWLKKNLI